MFLMSLSSAVCCLMSVACDMTLCLCVLMQIQNNKKKQFATLLMFITCSSCLHLNHFVSFMFVVQSQCYPNADSSMFGLFTQQ